MMEPGIEPGTSSFVAKCSTELDYLGCLGYATSFRPPRCLIGLTSTVMRENHEMIEFYQPATVVQRLSSEVDVSERR